MAERRKLAVVAKPGRSAPRRRLKEAVDQESPASSYFSSGAGKKDLMFVSSGCQIYDEALGGGYVLGRVVNLVGDKSSGKTLQAIEITANFHKTYADGLIRYAEAEAAFDQAYAAALGMPVEAVDFAEGINTVEDFYNDIMKFLDALKGRPGVYVLDSLDSLSDDAEMKRDIDEGSFGMTKQKKMGELFRKLVRRLESEKVLLVIISQIREKIGVTFGEKYTRSGGKALDFYATHVVWYSQIEVLKKIIRGVERPYGVQIRAKVKKNKIGLPLREAEFPILFGYGVDDLMAGVQWLLEIKREDLLADLGLTKAGYKVRLNNLRDKGGQETKDFRAKLNKIVTQEWRNIEIDFMPKSSKY